MTQLKLQATLEAIDESFATGDKCAVVRLDHYQVLKGEIERLTEHAERIADAVGFPAHNYNRQNTSVISTNIRNMKRFSEYLHAIEQEFLMVPGEPDEDCPDEPTKECLVNSWGSSRDEYILQFAKAIARMNAAHASKAVMQAMSEPGFSDPVVNVDDIQAAIADMEK